MLFFDLLTRPKMSFKGMHQKEVTHSSGSYERKSRGRKLADEMGRGKKFPWYTHRLMHRKRVTCELHDSYFRRMTITQAIPKIAEVTHPDRQISEEIAEVWRRVHISAWEFEGNIRPTNWTEYSWVRVPVGGEMWQGKPHPAEGALGSPDWIGVQRRTRKTQRCRP